MLKVLILQNCTALEMKEGMNLFDDNDDIVISKEYGYDNNIYYVLNNEELLYNVTEMENISDAIDELSNIFFNPQLYPHRKIEIIKKDSNQNGLKENINFEMIVENLTVKVIGYCINKEYPIQEEEGE